MIMISLSTMIFSAEDEDDIATKLQAGYRGMRVREEMRRDAERDAERDVPILTSETNQSTNKPSIYLFNL